MRKTFSTLDDYWAGKKKTSEGKWPQNRPRKTLWHAHSLHRSLADSLVPKADVDVVTAGGDVTR
jgi:hypothetical protein